MFYLILNLMSISSLLDSTVLSGVMNTGLSYRRLSTVEPASVCHNYQGGSFSASAASPPNAPTQPPAAASGSPEHVGGELMPLQAEERLPQEST